MERKCVLPGFSVRGFMEHVSKGLEEKSRIDEEQRREKEEVEARRRRKRDEETAFWTTPGLRPLAEPLILDWDCFFRFRIPSDLRYKALFPNDPEKRSKVKDLVGELAVLTEYSKCVRMIRDDPETDDSRREFYKNLSYDVYEAWQEVDKEYIEIYEMATGLSRFEFLCLDNEGHTTRLEQWIEKGADVFYGWGDEPRKKYRHLVPSDFVENRLATFECSWVDFNGTGSTATIQMRLSEGNDILSGWPQEVQEKYGHLRSILPPRADVDSSRKSEDAAIKSYIEQPTEEGQERGV